MEIEQRIDGIWGVKPFKYVRAGDGLKVHIQPFHWGNTACFAGLPTTLLGGTFEGPCLCKKCQHWLAGEEQRAQRINALEERFKAERKKPKQDGLL